MSKVTKDGNWLYFFTTKVKFLDGKRASEPTYYVQGQSPISGEEDWILIDPEEINQYVPSNSN